MPGYFLCSRFYLIRRKIIFCRIVCFFSIASTFICAEAPAQRVQIDVLKKNLLLQHDTAKINCLNILSLAYTCLNTDSAVSYAQKAFTDALEINYTSGLVMSLNNNAHIAGIVYSDFPLQEKLSLETLRKYANIADAKVLTVTYMNLALALFCQSYFDRAAAACTAIIQLAEKTGDKKSLGEAVSVMGCIGLETGNYEKAFADFNQGLLLFRSINDSYNTAILLAKVGDLYRIAGDSKTALGFYYQSLQYPKGASLDWHPLVDLGDTYFSLEKYDEALYQEDAYMQAIKAMTIRSNNAGIPKIRAAEIQIASKNFDTALFLLKPALIIARRANERNQLMRLLLSMAKAYKGKGEYRKAYDFTKELLQNANDHNAKQYLRDGYKLMSELQERMKNRDSAFFYYRQYAQMKDSVALFELSKKLAIYKVTVENEKKQAQIELLKNEKLIGQQQLQLSGQQLKDESLQKNILIISIVVLLLLSVIIVRNIKLQQKNQFNLHEITQKELALQKLESERIKSELQQHASELKMQALRAQMNPHFIFNSLNSINRFILQSNKEQASEYLTMFSRLIRLILQNSQSSLVPLESELEALQAYLELEAVRFDNHFSFTIHVSDELDAAALKVPPLIIQPYAENAIWHGLMHKESKGYLRIELYESDQRLHCKIADDGVGRAKSAEFKSKFSSTHKSMGMQITASRIAMLQDEKQSLTQIIITDLVLPDGTAGGTEVLLNIPVCYD